MEAVIHHFKLFTEGYSVPAGDVYVAVESGRGENGCYVVSDGTHKPRRVKFRAASFVNLQPLERMALNHMVADLGAIIGTVDAVRGAVDRRPRQKICDIPRTPEDGLTPRRRHRERAR